VAGNEEIQMARRPHPETLREAAIRYANHGIPILPDKLADRRPDLAATAPICTCRRRDCPALPVHPPRRHNRNNGEQHMNHVGRWWTATPDAAIATVAGAAFDVIEIHTAIPPDAILQWLADQDLTPGPARPYLPASDGSNSSPRPTPTSQTATTAPPPRSCTWRRAR
jgi:hypothetical protein